MAKDGNIVPVIMSGGAGTRLWPLSRPERPKQLLALTGTETMLQMTANRVVGWPLASAPIVVTGARQAPEIEAQLAAIGVTAAALILEPEGRNTAPAVALAALAADPDSSLLVMPSDHFIAAPERLRQAVELALPAAEAGWLVTFGIEPTAPETGYGYIQQGEVICPGVHSALRFAEKPDAGTARAFLDSGDYYWNAGIFLFQAGAMIEALRAHAPEVLAAATAALEGRQARGRVELDPEAFSHSPSISIDHAVMERAERVAVVPVEMEWSDVGSWDALYELSAKDEDGNVAGNGVVLEGVRNCLVRSSGPVVAALGVEDLIIVATDEAVLILPRGRSQEIRALVEAVKTRRRSA